MFIQTKSLAMLASIIIMLTILSRAGTSINNRYSFRSIVKVWSPNEYTIIEGIRPEQVVISNYTYMLITYSEWYDYEVNL